MARSRDLVDVRLVRNVLIPLSDGVTLAADLHLPGTPGPHPTLISLYPYRKDDIIGAFAAYARRWFAQRGYAHLLVDVRGYGGSEGKHAEALNPVPESADCSEVVEWAAAQEWSDGAVGVWGVSYGGLTALAAGAARPPHLRAIAPIYPLWDIYADMATLGGCPAMLGQHQWSTMMVAQRLAPPTCRDADGRWLRVWRERLSRLKEEGPVASVLQAHPERDAYWREHVLAVEHIEVPTFLVGGWRDLFPEAVAAAYERIPAPKRLLFGPWLHVQPDVAAREPVDWLSLLLRFWDEHLRGAPSAGDPPALVYVQGDAGGWRGETSWPPLAVETRALRPADGGALGETSDSGADDYASTPLVGSAGGQWDTLATGMGYPLDQGEDDRRSLTYTGDPVDSMLELAGSPLLRVDVERLDGDAPFDLVARLVDVAPDGAAELITSGHARTRGGPTDVVLWATAWALAPGHRIRLSVSCADFPRTWPEPTAPRIRIHRATSELRLPVVPGGIGEVVEPPRPEPVPATERFPWTISGGPEWTIERDLARDALTVALGGRETIRLPEGGTLALRQRASARVAAAQPQGASVDGEVAITIDAEDGERVEVEVRSRATRDRNLCWGRVTIAGQTLVERSWRNF